MVISNVVLKVEIVKETSVPSEKKCLKNEIKTKKSHHSQKQN